MQLRQDVSSALDYTTSITEMPTDGKRLTP